MLVRGGGNGNRGHGWFTGGQRRGRGGGDLGIAALPNFLQAAMQGIGLELFRKQNITMQMTHLREEEQPGCMSEVLSTTVDWASLTSAARSAGAESTTAKAESMLQ